MTFFNKLKWILGILMIFVVIASTNLIDRNNFIRVKDSVVSIYEDRLVAKALLFEISESIQEKEIAFIRNDSTFFNNRNENINKSVENNIYDFEHTKLTSHEKQVFENLKNNFQSLKKSEIILLSSGFNNTSDFKKHMERVKENLHDLSLIQLSEGQRQLNISQEAIESIELFTQIEIYLLIALAIVIQVLVLYKPKKSEEVE